MGTSPAPSPWRDRLLFLFALLAMAFPVAACLQANPPPAPDAAPPNEEVETMSNELPECADAKGLAALDGKRVRLVGMYRKALTRRKMRGPGEFLGEVEIELAGRAADYDPKAGDNLKAVVEIGKRPPEEVEKLADERVRVDGVLDLDPYKEVREAKVDYATVIFGSPQLHEVTKVELAGGG